MRSLCSWCGVELPSVAADNLPPDAVTHGICEDCANQLMAEMGTPLQQFLDGLAMPVIVVDSNGRLVAASTKACNLVGKELAEINGRLGVEVFDCVNAHLPGGCGKSIHCSGCTIRNTVMATHATGGSYVQVPAVLKAYRAGASPEIDMYITTQKVNSVVLLRIDSADETAMDVDAPEAVSVTVLGPRAGAVSARRPAAGTCEMHHQEQGPNPDLPLAFQV